ncbi:MULTISPECIES: hypothetical protein [Mycobacteriaceae]|uniref:Uncharacterized protein n=1 Tax=Mycolicibacterium neoaurum VKM Ac-1815D TaxID=700508 RepID=V5XIJ1_MYCNE|nr:MULTISPECIES: hypothetical protein [Mycobacteriaceae]AXK76784.1 hypothetical protein DXK33_18500 [Mycolicibacterium neoaurum]KUM10203.1 hypothetical protein AVZ31_00530 [Mycolicibacterium neoaurum]WBP96288.1 hypothetical protein O7W24_09050 [Mycolicibacterium neoaurum]WBS10181.1 hypothetical protein O6072_10135 [Mycolicibacterium neoaurum]
MGTTPKSGWSGAEDGVGGTLVVVPLPVVVAVYELSATGVPPPGRVHPATGTVAATATHMTAIPRRTG